MNPNDLRPRVFALHGVPHNLDSPDILGWGMELPNGGRTIFAELASSSVHVSDSAEQLRLCMSAIANVELTWLNVD
jgi:hypothetical protein